MMDTTNVTPCAPKRSRKRHISPERACDLVFWGSFAMKVFLKTQSLKYRSRV